MNDEICPECENMMEIVGPLPSTGGDYRPYLYQCPKCKTVKIIWE